VLDVIVSADFDEDAELQANIWNSLVRKIDDITEEENFIVTAESILVRHKESIMLDKRPSQRSKQRPVSPSINLNWSSDTARFNDD